MDILSRRRWADVAGAFKTIFGGDGDVSLFSAPGRIELCGNHTDHQHGRVLAGAISLAMYGAAAPNGLDAIRIHSLGYHVERVNLDELKPCSEEVGKSSALVRGVAARFCEMGYPVAGFDAYIVSEVPKGIGMSSSAAFEVLIGTIINALYCGGEVPPIEIAKAGQYAENVFFGKPCGLMDQAISAIGGVAAMDFSDPDNPLVEPLPADFSEYALCIIETGGDHSSLIGEYAAIAAEMAAVAGFFGEKWLRDVNEDEFYNSIRDVKAALGDRATLRAMHFFSEDARAAKAADALKNGDVGAFLSIVAQSGRSSWMYLQNISKPGAANEQPAAFVLALCDRLLRGEGAFRIHGGGFAGTIQAFVPLDMSDSFIREVDNVMGDGACRVVSIRELGGIQII